MSCFLNLHVFAIIVYSSIPRLSRSLFMTSTIAGFFFSINAVRGSSLHFSKNTRHLSKSGDDDKRANFIWAKYFISFVSNYNWSAVAKRSVDFFFLAFWEIHDRLSDKRIPMWECDTSGLEIVNVDGNSVDESVNCLTK